MLELSEVGIVEDIATPHALRDEGLGRATAEATPPTQKIVQEETNNEPCNI